MSNTGYFQYNLRSQIHCAPGSIIRLPALFEGLGAKRVVILTDPGSAASELLIALNVFLIICLVVIYRNWLVFMTKLHQTLALKV